MTVHKLLLGPLEADMLLDGLIALSGTWEDRGEIDPPVTADMERRQQRLFQKLRPLAQRPTYRRAS